MPQPPSDSALLADLALARGGIDRRAEFRADAQWLERAWADEGTRVLAVRDGVIPLKADAARVRRMLPAEVPDDAERLLLGTDTDGVTWFAARMPAEGPSAGLREVGAEWAAMTSRSRRPPSPSTTGTRRTCVARAAGHPRCPLRPDGCVGAQRTAASTIRARIPQ